MTESQPQIHGIINRDEMWSRWAPYGERLRLDGTLTEEQVTAAEAAQVILAAHGEEQTQAWARWYKDGDGDDWLAGLRSMKDEDLSPELRSLIVLSHRRQQSLAEDQRKKAIDLGMRGVNALQKAIVGAVEEGLVTVEQGDKMAAHLVGPDGLPLLQYTPMSRLEYARMVVGLDGDMPADSSSAATDFCHGALWAPLSLSADVTHGQYSKVHGSVYGVSGLEIHDITRNDLRRFAVATVVGTFASTPTVDVRPGDDMTLVENGELSEGYADFITNAFMRAVPQLGKAGVFDGYSAWGDGMAYIAKNYPRVYRKIGDVTTLVEATPAQPNAKRDALKELHVFADAVIGEKDSLRKIIVGTGKKLTEVHVRNAQ